MFGVGGLVFKDVDFFKFIQIFFDFFGKLKSKFIYKKMESWSKYFQNGNRRDGSWVSVENKMVILILLGLYNIIEVFVLRLFDVDVFQYMYNFFVLLLQKEWRFFCNLFGVVFFIFCFKCQFCLSSVMFFDVQEVLRNVFKENQCFGMFLIQFIREILVFQVQDVQFDKVKLVKNMVFVFDIDGVLVYGDCLIFEGKMVFDMFNGNNQFGIKIFYIFFINGFGKFELVWIEQLFKIFQNFVNMEQFIQLYIFMCVLVEYYNIVFVVGGEGYKCCEVVEQYGFKDIIVFNDIVVWDEFIVFYCVFIDEECVFVCLRDFFKVNIDVIMVFFDLRDYVIDMQIIMDLFVSENGWFGIVVKDFVFQWIFIYFFQGDFFCLIEYFYFCMLQGVFCIGFEVMYKVYMGVDLECVVYGKFELVMYKYVDEVIVLWMDVFYGEERILENIYMIGDNLVLDIVGGNMYGWNICLVRMGVFQGGENDEENLVNFGVFVNVWEVVMVVCRKQLGDDFKFKWDDWVNLVLYGNQFVIY